MLKLFSILGLNSVANEGAIAFAQMLKVNSTLLELNLCN